MNIIVIQLIIFCIYFFINNNALVISSNQGILSIRSTSEAYNNHHRRTKLQYSKGNNHDMISNKHIRHVNHAMKSNIFQLRGGMLNDFSVTALVLGESIIWLKIWTTLAKNNILGSYRMY